MNKTYIRAASAAVCAALLAACTTGNVLNVVDRNNPDVARAYGTPAGVESLIGGLYLQMNNAWNTTNDEPASQMMSLEGFATVANFCMNVRAAVPPNAILNGRGNQCDTGNFTDFSRFQKLARNSANLVLALDAITKANGTTGSPAEDATDRSFAQFVDGISLGNVALMYDSAAIVTNVIPADSIPPLSGYNDVMVAALAEIDSAIATATGPAGFLPSGLPASWINGNPMTLAQYLAFMHSWKARLRAGVARTPAERAAVNWADVIADATAGISGDIRVTVGGGWSCSYDCSQMYASNGWHEMSLMILGMGDTSGVYAGFIATPFGTRDGSQLVIHSPDTRLPQGATRADQQLDTPIGGTSFTPGRYFANRPTSGDFPGPGFGTSQYDHKRWLAVFKAKVVGPVVQFSKAENDMLAAEGDIRTGAYAAAAVLINTSRALHGLPPVGVTDNTSPIAGGAGCVPQVPQPPAFNTTACGTMMEALKWEKRMETAYVNYASWYHDGRGWGDLVYGMPTMWPVPNEEMDSRQEPFYNMGGIGNPGSAGQGTYGF
ncbi:MAG: hypothetical protein ACREN6_06765 [Gemmatimonadaceae bacterium]